MRATHFYISVFCAICACMAVVYAVLYLWFTWQSGTCIYRDQGLILDTALTLECVLEILVAQHKACRINYAGWLFVLMMPVATFLTTPYTNSRKRIFVLLAAMICGYLLLSIFMLHASAIGHYVYNQCQNQFADGYVRSHAECRERSWIPNTASRVFFLFFGWLLPVAYAGIWEIVWRIYHRRTIKRMGKRFKGRWFSNLLVVGILAPWIAPWLLILVL